MFIGEYSHTIDEKGRLAIPAKMRAKLMDGAVVTRGIDTCLFVYTKEEWEKLAQKLAALPLTDSRARAFVRLMLAGAMDVEFDKQGRILLPNYLRAYANLKKQAVVTGLYNRLEIWDETAWKEFKAKTEQDTEDINNHLVNLGI
jgi:MraZ protein